MGTQRGVCHNVATITPNTKTLYGISAGDAKYSEGFEFHLSVKLARKFAVDLIYLYVLVVVRGH